MEQLRAAVENGADAVYMGGKLFNARINAVNEAVIAHEAQPEDILSMDFHGVIPEVTVKGKIPVILVSIVLSMTKSMI